MSWTAGKRLAAWPAEVCQTEGMGAEASIPNARRLFFSFLIFRFGFLSKKNVMTGVSDLGGGRQ
jgi:hypothetical protein